MKEIKFNCIRTTAIVVSTHKYSENLQGTVILFSFSLESVLSATFLTPCWFFQPKKKDILCYLKSLYMI